MAGPGNILIKVGADAGQAIRELGTLDKSLGSTMTTSDKFGAGIKKAALPAAAALGALTVAGIDAAKAAAEDAAGREKLMGVLERQTGITEKAAGATDDWIEKLTIATGVTDDKLRPALARLASSTGDVGEAQKALKIALDVSAATGKDVVAVSNAIGKAYDGQTAGLNKLGLGIDSATLKSKDMSAIMGEIADKTGGAMADQAATAAGQYQIFTNQMQELKETLGAALLPVMEAFLPILNQLGTFASENTTAIKILVGVIAGLAAGILIANAAMKLYAAAQVIVKAATTAWTAAQWLLNAALEANPIGLIILALVALGAAIVIAYKKSETFRDIVNGALQAVLSVVRALGDAFRAAGALAAAAFDWIIGHWKVALFAFGPIGAAVVLIADNFDTLKNVALGALNVIKSAIDLVAGAIESVISAVGRLIDALSHIHVPHISLPFGLSAAAPASAGFAAAAAGYGRASFAGAGAGTRAVASSSGLTINIYGAVDPEGTARSIARLLRQHDRRQGRP